MYKYAYGMHILKEVSWLLFKQETKLKNLRASTTTHHHHHKTTTTTTKRKISIKIA